MKKIIILFVFTIASISSLFSQISALESVELVDTNAVFRMTNVEMLGVDKTTTPHQLLYSFVHPNGGVQSVRGSLFSGGKTPINLPAFGKVALEEQLKVSSNKLQWVATKRSGTSVNFYAKPLTSIHNMVDKYMLAKKGNIISTTKYRQMGNKLTPSSSLHHLAKKMDKEEAKTEPYYVENYKTTIISMALNGKISYLTTGKLSLKPKEERNKGLFGKAYDTDYDTNRENTKTAISDDKNIRIKGGTRQVNDPVSGHATIMGGLKYKKDKTKKYSHYREFVILTFNNDGEIVKRLKYESEAPIALEEAYPIYGKNLAPGVDEVTHGVFILKGDGKKKMNGVKRKLRKILVIDVRTGEIVAEDEVTLKRSSTRLMREKRLDGNKIALTYFNPVKGHQGILEMVLSVKGIENVKEIDGKTPGFKAINFREAYLSALKQEIVSTIDIGDGKSLSLERFFTAQNNTNGKQVNKKIEGYALIKYDENGYLDKLAGLGGQNIKVINIKDGKISLLSYIKEAKDLYRLAFVDVNIDDLSIRMVESPENDYLLDKSSYYYDDTLGVFYFLTQKSKGKGLSIHRYKM